MPQCGSSFRSFSSNRLGYFPQTIENRASPGSIFASTHYYQTASQLFAPETFQGIGQGASCIAGPDGAILAVAAEGESLLLADLDFELIERSRRRYDYLPDRRQELFGSPKVAATRLEIDSQNVRKRP